MLQGYGLCLETGVFQPSFQPWYSQLTKYQLQQNKKHQNIRHKALINLKANLNNHIKFGLHYTK